MKIECWCYLLVALCVLGCRKQSASECKDSVVDRAAMILRTSLRPAVLDSVEISKPIVSKQGKDWYLRYRLQGQQLEKRFVLLKLPNDTAKPILNIVQLERQPLPKGAPFEGKVAISDGQGEVILQSAIRCGYIVALHPRLSTHPTTKVESLVDPYQELPEVIVTAARPTHEAVISVADWYLLSSLVSDGQGYAPATSSGGGAGGTGDAGSYAGVYSPATADPATDPSVNFQDIKVSIDPTDRKPGIDLEAWLHCFDALPDAGAQYSITLCGDLPVSDDPSINVNFYTGATGHCFLQLEKKNGGTTVRQVIGFAAVNGLQALAQTDGYVSSKLVNNAGHKYNASITMNLNTQGFATVLSTMRVLNGRPYSVQLFDCLDHDLAVFNSVRADHPLVLEKIPEPGNAWSMISTGPVLYQLLSQMKAQGDPESSNIYVGSDLFIGDSHGPCQ